MNFDIRTKLIFAFLLGDESGLLHGYTQPDRLSDEMARDEVNYMVRDMNAQIPSATTESEFHELFERIRTAVRRRHGMSTWPKIKLMLTCLDDALAAAPKQQNTRDVESVMLDNLASWFRKFGTELPSCGSMARTQALVDRGVLTAQQARVGGFMMSNELTAIAIAEINAGEKDA